MNTIIERTNKVWNLIRGCSLGLSVAGSADVAEQGGLENASDASVTLQ
jgi:hypothetical protein